MVEAQHVASTMKIVDSPAEQDVLEALLDGAKPALPPEAEPLDYLLATPFRYPPLPGGSRFRSGIDPGVFYGADTVATAGAELGYWRWRFLHDAVDLERLEPVPHTAFGAEVATTTVDVRCAPFDRDAEAWTHPTDYRHTQAFARVARSARVGGILYRSVRSAVPAWCLALLTPAGFAHRKPLAATQTWWLAVSVDGVQWRRDAESMTFAADAWRTP
ncbi:RES family NAD+ phosphorylase [Nitrogeniibacter mangrovi]|uniref:RES family NAD+ phosphorylase n=2 Tax=Nitrogeniibacter mangrovi TaxID=2016596 RepID=A0A6C1B9X6_9RHOO|nr:RES family NAD+ phosphorylase [Nitrogeniibacter mangrovi]